MTKDPVCGMLVDEASSRLKSEYMGKTYTFCSPGCKKSFDNGPDKHLGGSTTPMATKVTAKGRPTGNPNGERPEDLVPRGPQNLRTPPL